MIQSANLGFPRIGARRELKKAVEKYWKGDISASDLNSEAQALRARHWQLQAEAGIEVIPSGDFSLYDQMLDMIATLGAAPQRYDWSNGAVGLDLYFAMARGDDSAEAMEMTKWFDTNYHYIVPEFTEGMEFRLASPKPVEDYRAAREQGIKARPVIIGPVTFLKLGKVKRGAFDKYSLLDKLLPVYEQLLKELSAAGADWVQVDEPVLSLDLSQEERDAFKTAYDRLGKAGPKLLLASYFERVGDNLGTLASLPIHGAHLDLVRTPDQLEPALKALPKDWLISLGVINGRNIWRADLDAAFAPVETALRTHGGDLQIAPSCSLLHTPIDLDQESKLDDALKQWLAFAKQKLGEVAALTEAAKAPDAERPAAFEAARKARDARKASKLIHRDHVKTRASSVVRADHERKSPFETRRGAQKDSLKLPAYPTTTIGSLPQTKEVRQQRAAFRRGDISAEDYETFLKEETQRAVRKQEEMGVDVLVHGEFERNDMVEYFGEQLDGFAFTKHGWVQSYGSRCVKPPIIYGDVHRENPMTVDWSVYAQSLTDKPMKGMLTGPVTILQWSFVRDDQPRAETCRQIALAIRDEASDLEKAGINVIQIDEPAIREGLPLRAEDHKAYIDWAVDSFRLSSSGVSDGVQIHTHMCYSEFNDIMAAIAAMDADVISIEASRSDMELLGAFNAFDYPNEIGPGVWDIHSPRVPDAEEMERQLRETIGVLKPEQIWVNPDCGLKTRGWEEVEPSMKNMVEAAKRLRG